MAVLKTKKQRLQSTYNLVFIVKLKQQFLFEVITLGLLVYIAKVKKITSYQTINFASIKAIKYKLSKHISNFKTELRRNQ